MKPFTWTMRGSRPLEEEGCNKGRTGLIVPSTRALVQRHFLFRPLSRGLVFPRLGAEDSHLTATTMLWEPSPSLGPIDMCT